MGIVKERWAIVYNLMLARQKELCNRCFSLSWRKRIRDASRYTIKKNIAQAFILERYFFVSIYPAASHGTCLAVFLVAV
ncbi:MAG: hypothetical protein MSA05_04890, partial [Prevotella sp.]|uniref:hypothetical protein n=1 Tax=Prevotella sp. TaxID=59823 RepID=UPI0025F14422